MTLSNLKSATAAAALAAALSLAGTNAGAQTLQETVQKAISSSPTIGVVTNNRQAVEQELRQARGLYLPQIDAKVAGGPEWTDNASTRARGAGTDRLTRVERQIFLQQRVFDGFETDSEVERQIFRSKSAANRVYESSEFTGLDAVEAHINTIRQRRLVSINEEYLTELRRLLTRVRSRAIGGAGAAADVAQAQARIDQGSATLAETRNGLQDAESMFIRVVGERPGQLADAPYPAQALPANLDVAITNAVAKNPTVAIRDADIEVGDAEIRLADSRFWPKLNIELSGRNDRNLDGVSGRDAEATALLVMRWNLYRGGIDQANRREALGRLAQAKSSKQVSVRSAEEEMRRSWAQLESATARVQALRSAVQLNTTVRAAYYQQFELGQRSLLDLLDQEQEVFVSRGRLLTAEASRIFAAYRMLAVQGQLNATLGVQLPVEADASKPAPVPADRDWQW
jgi:adhesin transport system outer membrane protein